MKKIIITALLVFVMALPAMAKDLINLPNPSVYSQTTFDDLSRELGLAFSYYPLSPAQSLAGSLIPFGFDAGVEVTAVKLDRTAPHWKLMGTDAPDSLYIPKLHIQVGFKLPFVPFIPPIDLGVVYAQIPTTDIKLTGGEVKIGITEDGLLMPAIALRGAMTKLSGLEKIMELSTTSLDISISKKFLLVTPYLGYGIVKITNTPLDPTATTDLIVNGVVLAKGLTKAELTEDKIFAGLKFSLGLINLVAEVDKSTIMAYSLRLNLSF